MCLRLSVRCQITCKNWHKLIIWRKCNDTNCHRNCQFAWYGLQNLCISLCRSLLKTIRCPIADHAKILILAGTVFNCHIFSCIGLCHSLHKNYDLSNCKPCKNIDISWDGLQFSCIRLCHSLLKNYDLSNCKPCRNIDISWDSLPFPYICFCQSLHKTMMYPIADQARILILAETICKFHALAYTGACFKLWVIRL